MTTTSERPRGILNPRAAGEQLAFAWYGPADDLADVVDRHWAVRWDLRDRAPFVQVVLPHAGANLCFEPTGASVHGVITRRATHPLEGVGLSVGTMFTPAGFAGFAAMAMGDLTDRGVPLSEALAGGEALEREVEGAVDVEARIAAVERFLRARRPPTDPAVELVNAIVAWMLASPVGTRVTEVAACHGLSPRTLQRLFRRYIGVGPKWVLQRYRLHEAAERIASGRVVAWSDLALELGYADQAHFVRDFHAVVGQTPSAYAAVCRRVA
jgi:AraC-like DNA-binding protein